MKIFGASTQADWNISDPGNLSEALCEFTVPEDVSGGLVRVVWGISFYEEPASNWLVGAWWDYPDRPVGHNIQTPYGTVNRLTMVTNASLQMTPGESYISAGLGIISGVDSFYYQIAISVVLGHVRSENVSTSMSS